MDEKQKDEHLRAIAEAAWVLDPGTRTSVRELALCALADIDPDDLDDIVFDLGFDRLFAELDRACEENGTLLDGLHNTALALGLPHNLDFVIRRIANCDRGPVSIGDVEGVSFSSGGFFQGWSEVVILREGEGFELRLAESGPADPVDREPCPLTPERVEILAEAIRRCKIHEWRQDYMDYDVLDGEQWELQVNLAGGEVIVCHGSNAYPPRFRMFQEAMLKVGGLHG